MPQLEHRLSAPRGWLGRIEVPILAYCGERLMIVALRNWMSILWYQQCMNDINQHLRQFTGVQALVTLLLMGLSQWGSDNVRIRQMTKHMMGPQLQECRNPASLASLKTNCPTPTVKREQPQDPGWGITA